MSATQARIEAVPTQLVLGGDAGRRLDVLHGLLARRVAGEPWAVLRAATSFSAGAVTSAAPGLVVAVAPASCPCCTGQLAFRVALNRLLRSARPQRLLVELGHHRHDATALEALAGSAYQGVLRLDQVIDLDAGTQGAGAPGQ